jgi:hypothetical protein
VIQIINDAGGLSFIAHPGNMPEILIRNLLMQELMEKLYILPIPQTG